MSSNMDSLSVEDFFNAAGLPIEILDSVQWQHNKQEPYPYMKAIETALEKLYSKFFPLLTGLVKTVLVVYNGENEGTDYRISVLIGISDGVFDPLTATYMVVRMRVNTATDQIERASIGTPGARHEAFLHEKGQWYVC